MDSNPRINRKLKKPNRSWIRPLLEGGGARYLQITQQITGAIKDGVLRPGDRLPPQRHLAQDLGVDLTTVTRAYNELRQAGLLDALGAGGSYIASSVSGDEQTIDLSMNVPPRLPGAQSSRLLQVGLAHLQEETREAAWMNYHVGAGNRSDREAAAAWLAPALGTVDADRIIVCAGAQAALGALLLARSNPGDSIATDTLTYPGFLNACRIMQRTIAPVACDHEGMLPADLERVCQTRAPALLYLVPTIHNPTTITMSAARRQAIHAVASRHQVPIIEDDPYWLLAQDAPPPLATQAGPQRTAPVFYISTLSKCISPGLRIAYLVVPRSEPLEPMLDALRAITLMTNQNMAAMASYWIRSGLAQEILGKIRQQLHERQKMAATLLPGAQGHPYGLHVWLALPPKLDQYRLIQTAFNQGLGVASSDAFSVTESTPHAIRISLGGAPDLNQLKTALDRLREILEAADPGPARNAIV